MYHTASRAWCQAVGPRVDRGVRPRSGADPRSMVRNRRFRSCAPALDACAHMRGAGLSRHVAQAPRTLLGGALALVSQRSYSEHERAFFSRYGVCRDGLEETSGRFLRMKTRAARREVGLRGLSRSWLPNAMSSKRGPLALDKQADLQLAASEA